MSTFQEPVMTRKSANIRRNSSAATAVPETAVLAVLKERSRAELIVEYERVYGFPPQPHAREKLLSQAVAHRRQEQASGGSDRRLERRLARLAEALRTTGRLPVSSRPPVKPGTRLLREWNGETHTVTVTQDGFVYRDEIFRSLSVIARAITGTRWSGLDFFGLKNGESPASMTETA
jgi:hypothetical protein